MEIIFTYLFLKSLTKDMFTDSRERGREGRVEREQHWWVASWTRTSWGSNPSQLRYVPWLGLNRDQTHHFVVYGTMLQPSDPPRPGWKSLKKCLSILEILFIYF